MSYFNRIKELLNSSHSTFHVVDLLKKDLEEKGFVRLDENEDFEKIFYKDRWIKEDLSQKKI